MQRIAALNRFGLRRPVDARTKLCLLLLLLAASEFAVRGPLRAIRTGPSFNDFLSPYIQAKALVRGLDPYSPEVLLRLWPPEAAHFMFLPGEVANGTLVANRGFPTAYPITALVLLAPFTVLPWNVASWLWFVANLLLYVIMLRAVLELAGFYYVEPRGILLIAATLALAPFHTCLAAGNPTAIAVELSVIGLWQARLKNDLTAATLFAISAGLKPQIGLIFVFYYLLRRRRRLFVTAAVLLAFVGAAGLLWLGANHTPWFGNYVRDNRILFETGKLGNFTDLNPLRFGLINLQVALYPLIGGVQWTNDTARVVGAILLVCWLIGFALGERDRSEVLELAALAICSLLPIYHRFYDASLLVLPVCWAFVSFGRNRRVATVALLLTTPFLVPGGTALQTLQENGRIPASLAGRAWWQAFVMAHEIWALLLLSLLLLGAMFAQRRVREPRTVH
ncbi:MAG TPA: glycosyltransferase family 87 protein [Candidatus Sulfotelmatobacter sp.]|jgi:hypothetical protein